MELTAAESRSLHEIVHRGLKDASLGISAMTGNAIHLSAPHMGFTPLNLVPNIAGGPAAVVVAIYLGFEGDLDGHLMLLFTEPSACRVVELLLELAPQSLRSLDDMGISALAETGNVTGSYFLNALSGRTGHRLTPTTPAVITDMAGAILEAVVAELYLAGDEALVVETGFGGGVTGHFLLMPDQPSMARLIAALERLE